MRAILTNEVDLLPLLKGTFNVLTFKTWLGAKTLKKLMPVE